MLNQIALGYTLPQLKHLHLVDTENHESKGSSLMVYTELYVLGGRQREKKGNMAPRAGYWELYAGPLQQEISDLKSLEIVCIWM